MHGPFMVGPSPLSSVHHAGLTSVPEEDTGQVCPPPHGHGIPPGLDSIPSGLLEALPLTRQVLF